MTVPEPMEEPREGVDWTELLAPSGVCDDMDFPQSHCGFCVNWRPLEDDRA